MVQDQQQGAPGKPFFLYFALGAMHAPHHVAPEWVEPYRGVFDKGWDAWREELFARQVATGVVPEGTVLTPRPEWVQAWSELSADERRHARPPAGGLRGLPDPHRRPDRPRALVAREPRGDGQHARHGVLRQRRQRRGRQGRQRQRAPLHARTSASRWPTTSPTTTTGAGSPPTTTTRGPGPGPATRRTSSGSATPGSAARARRSSSTGAAASRARASCGPSSRTPST